MIDNKIFLLCRLESNQTTQKPFATYFQVTEKPFFDC